MDVRAIDMSVTVFGTTWDSPLVLAPVGAQRAFHLEGEIATARAARARKHLQILWTMSSTGVEEVNAARGEPIWYQLYPTDQWPCGACSCQAGGNRGLFGAGADPRPAGRLAS
jgi:isopentenyl diphosphate isomerase/L-lactate dehydrogenase-like FMN-dependent dehydrogenase